MHALSDPAFATTEPRKEEFAALDSMWQTGRLNKTFISLHVNEYSGRSCGKSSSLFPLAPLQLALHKLYSFIPPILHLTKMDECIGNIFFFPPLDFHSLHHLPGPESQKALFPFALENQCLSLSVLKKHPFLCFRNIMHLMSASTCGAEVVCSKYFVAFVVFSATLLSNFHL